MPNYNYLCSDCFTKLSEKLGRHPTEQEILGSEECPGAVFETYHGMFPTPAELKKATVCPLCNGTNTAQTLIGTDQHFYSKGYGWLDKAGIKRDMNLHRLVHDETGDPYEGQRLPGERDDLAHRLRKGKQKKPKIFVSAPPAKPKKAPPADAS